MAPREAPQTAASLTSGGAGQWMPMLEFMQQQPRRKQQMGIEKGVAIEGLDKSVDTTVNQAFASQMESIAGPDWAKSITYFPEATAALEFVRNDKKRQAREAAARGDYVSPQLSPEDFAYIRDAIEPGRRRGLAETERRIREEGGTISSAGEGRVAPGQTYGAVDPRRIIAPEAVRGEVTTQAEEVRKRAEARVKTAEAEVRAPHVAEAEDLAMRTGRAGTETAERQAAALRAEQTSPLYQASLEARQRYPILQGELATLQKEATEVELGIRQARPGSTAALTAEARRLEIRERTKQLQIEEHQLTDIAQRDAGRKALNDAMARGDLAAARKALVQIDPANAGHIMTMDAGFVERAAAMEVRVDQLLGTFHAAKTYNDQKPLADSINDTRMMLAAQRPETRDAQGNVREPTVSYLIVSPSTAGAKGKGDAVTYQLPLHVAQEYHNGELLARAKGLGYEAEKALLQDMEVRFLPMSTNSALKSAERFYASEGVPEATVLRVLEVFRSTRTEADNRINPPVEIQAPPIIEGQPSALAP